MLTTMVVGETKNYFSFISHSCCCTMLLQQHQTKQQCFIRTSKTQSYCWQWWLGRQYTQVLVVNRRQQQQQYKKNIRTHTTAKKLYLYFFFFIFLKENGAFNLDFLLTFTNSF